MIVINYKVQQQKICLTSEKPTIVNSSNNYLQLKFTFYGEDWDNLNKYVIFTVDKQDYLFTLDNENTVTIPDYCINQNRLIFTLYGEYQDVRITTKQQHILLKESGYTADTSSHEQLSKDIIVQIFEELDHKADKNNVYTKSEMDEIIENHTHTVSKITDFNENVGLEVKASFRQLANRIRTGDG